MPILCAFVGAIIGLVGDEMGVDDRLSDGAGALAGVFIQQRVAPQMGYSVGGIAARVTVGSVFGYVGAQGGKFLRGQIKKRA